MKRQLRKESDRGQIPDPDREWGGLYPGQVLEIFRRACYIMIS